MKLRAYFLISLALLLIHMTTEAAPTTTKLSTCSWIGANTNSIFTGCINNNFKLIKRAKGLDLSNCFNFDNTFSYAYQICVRKNFRHISEQLTLKLDNCPAIGEEVNVLYVSCVQKNFKLIERNL